MAKMQANDNGVIRTLGKIQVNDGGVVRTLKKAQANDNGVIRTIFQGGTLLGSKNIGSIVKITVSNTETDFIVAHKGKPSAMYHTSFDNGVVLMMKNIWESRQWHGSNVNDYQNSLIHAWLNNEFRDMIAQNIRGQIKQVRIPFRAGSGTSMTVTSGASGLSVRAFLLSAIEVGIPLATNYMPSDGEKLDYFLLGNDAGSEARTRRIATFSGTATGWWLRSPYTSGATSAWRVSASGDVSSVSASLPFGIRPALVLPDTLTVADDGTVIA